MQRREKRESVSGGYLVIGIWHGHRGSTVMSQYFRYLGWATLDVWGVCWRISHNLSLRSSNCSVELSLNRREEFPVFKALFVRNSCLAHSVVQPGHTAALFPWQRQGSFTTNTFQCLPLPPSHKSTHSVFLLWALWTALPSCNMKRASRSSRRKVRGFSKRYKVAEIVPSVRSMKISMLFQVVISLWGEGGEKRQESVCLCVWA